MGVSLYVVMGRGLRLVLVGETRSLVISFPLSDEAVERLHSVLKSMGIDAELVDNEELRKRNVLRDSQQ